MNSLLEMLFKYKDLFISGTKATLVVSIAGILLGLLLGVILSIMKIGKIKIFRWIANVYVEFIRGTPVLVQISMVFYGLPLLGINFPSIEIGGMAFDRLLSGILALSLNSSAYVCEVVRSGIQSVDKGQMEASLSLGFNAFDSMRLVVMPQAIKNILPALGNEFINLIKASSQVSVMGLADLMYTADTIRGISFEPFAPLVIVAIIYLVITFTLSCGVKIFEKRMNRSTV